mmetsp:Transcript_87484/g.237013  ORF Transcript_87484/g.237013 Transcript_87484/m.237013 type:complete len:311 (+) Transcript_87484:425-1357(+)
MQSRCCSPADSSSSQGRRANQPSASSRSKPSRPRARRQSRIRARRGCVPSLWLPLWLRHWLPTTSPPDSPSSHSSATPPMTRSWGLATARKTSCKARNVTTALLVGPREGPPPSADGGSSLQPTAPSGRKCSSSAASEMPEATPMFSIRTSKGALDGQRSTVGYASCVTKRPPKARYGAWGTAISNCGGGRDEEEVPTATEAPRPDGGTSPNNTRPNNDLPLSLGPVTSSGASASTSNVRPSANGTSSLESVLPPLLKSKSMTRICWLHVGWCNGCDSDIGDVCPDGVCCGVGGCCCNRAVNSQAASNSK